MGRRPATACIAVLERQPHMQLFFTASTERHSTRSQPSPAAQSSSPPSTHMPAPRLSLQCRGRQAGDMVRLSAQHDAAHVAAATVAALLEVSAEAGLHPVEGGAAGHHRATPEDSREGLGGQLPPQRQLAERV